MAPTRALASIWAAKAAARASQAFGRGGGTAIGGVLALRVDRDIARRLASQLGQGCVLVTGTNGKTTTSRLISETARVAGLDPLANASGSNLMRGITSTLALAAGVSGSIPEADRRLGVFEVDEATLPAALLALRPRLVVFTNLFRDQLDRYGEVETVAALWREALTNAPADLHLVLNADDPTVASLGEGREGVTYFGVDALDLNRTATEHASDALSCRCGARLFYDVAYFAHIGHWRCEACGRFRPRPHEAASNVQLRDGRSLRFQLVGAETSQALELGLGGLYNVYNALAAAATATALDLSADAVVAALNQATAAFGRQEVFEFDGRRVEVFLGKNPAGLNQVLSTLLLDPQRRTALFILNDDTADGRDVSWVWDADFEMAAAQFETVIVSGTRAEDLALRLKYAEWPEPSLSVVPDITQALSQAVTTTASGETLTIVPTYTAMLTVRALLARRAGRAPFWQEARLAP